MDLDRIGTRHRDNSHTYVAESEALDQISKVVSDHFKGIFSQNLLQAAFSQCCSEAKSSRRVLEEQAFFLCPILLSHSVTWLPCIDFFSQNH